MVMSALLSSLETILCTPKVMAACLGVHPRNLTDYEQNDLVVKVKRGQYDLMKTCARVVRHYREQAVKWRGSDGTTAIDANTALKDAQRRMTEIRIARMEGEVVSKAELIDTWTALALQAKQLFLAFPGRARFDLPHLTGADQEVLMRLANDMLSELAFNGEVVMPKSPADRESSGS